jgi:hypothetical protein
MPVFNLSTSAVGSPDRKHHALRVSTEFSAEHAAWSGGVIFYLLFAQRLRQLHSPLGAYWMYMPSQPGVPLCWSCTCEVVLSIAQASSERRAAASQDRASAARGQKKSCPLRGGSGYLSSVRVWISPLSRRHAQRGKKILPCHGLLELAHLSPSTAVRISTDAPVFCSRGAKCAAHLLAHLAPPRLF